MSLIIKIKQTTLIFKKKIMKLFFKLFSVLIMSFTFIVNSFAIDATTYVNIEKINDTEVNVSWAPVENAYRYYVSYWINSITDAEYDNVTDYIDWTGVTISWLWTWTTNYFSVTTLDESWNESELSTEVSIDLAANVFALKSVNVINSTSIELVFSEALDNTDWTEREFNIYNKADKLDSVWVIGSELNKEDPTRLKLELDTELQVEIEYEIVVIAIKNSELENIESGIDSIEVFTYNWIDKNANQTTSSEESASTELNSALSNSWPSWMDIESPSNELELNSAKELPKTWPESILIFILAIILTWLVFIFKFKQS